jgi:hypothetical protein
MISAFFPSGLAREERAKPEGKKELVCRGVLPRAAASAALPWATGLLPFQDARKANYGAVEYESWWWRSAV